MAKTLILNVTEGPISLPSPYSGMLASNGQGVIDDTPANVEAALGTAALRDLFRLREVTDAEATTHPVRDKVANAPVSTGGYAESGDYQIIPIDIPNAATTTYVYKAHFKMEIVDVHILKDTAGAGNTIQVTDAADAAITDAIAAAVDKALTRAGTIDKAKRTVNADGTFKIVATRAAGSMAAQAFLHVIRRA